MTWIPIISSVYFEYLLIRLNQIGDFSKYSNNSWFFHWWFFGWKLNGQRYSMCINQSSLVFQFDLADMSQMTIISDCLSINLRFIFSLLAKIFYFLFWFFWQLQSTELFKNKFKLFIWFRKESLSVWFTHILSIQELAESSTKQHQLVHLNWATLYILNKFANKRRLFYYTNWAENEHLAIECVVLRFNTHHIWLWGFSFDVFSWFISHISYFSMWRLFKRQLQLTWVANIHRTSVRCCWCCCCCLSLETYTLQQDNGLMFRKQ